MGLRFRKSVKLLPGVRINFNKKSTSVTFGKKGYHYTVNSNGKRTTTVGIPGTGISYSTTSGGKSEMQNSKSSNKAPQSTQTEAPNGWIPLEEPVQKPTKKSIPTWIVILLCFFALLFVAALFAIGNGTNSAPSNVGSAHSSVISSLPPINAVSHGSDLSSSSVSSNSNAEESSDHQSSMASTVPTSSSSSTSTASVSSSNSSVSIAVPSDVPEQSVTYVLNTNTKKIHYFSCSSVEKIKDKNYAESDLSVDELKAQGYEPCGSCKPH